jgi:hypothetical protein
MTVVARTFCSIPKRSALETWAAIVALLAPKAGSEARSELESVAGIASSLITREVMNSPIVVYGCGPRVRIYCVYNEDAITGDAAHENKLAFDATDGDWHMSLPCPADDLDWVVGALAKRTKKITARDQAVGVEADESSQAAKTARTDGTAGIDMEAFLKP